MAKAGLSSTKSPVNDSSLDGLFGGVRKSLFLTDHPLNGIVAKAVSIQKGKLSYDIDKKEIEYKEAPWDIKANFTPGKQEMNVKNALDKNLTANFGVKNNDVFLGGKYSMGCCSANFKLFTDLQAQLAVSAKPVDGLECGADASLDSNGIKAGLGGASYKLPVGQPAHIGAILSYPSMAASLGIFSQLPSVPGAKKATVGAEIQQSGAAMLGAEVVLDAQTTVKAKADLSGLSHISVVQNFKDMTVTCGVEADLLNGFAMNKFGAEVKVKK